MLFDKIIIIKWSYAFLNWLSTIYIGTCIALIPNGTFEKFIGDYTFIFVFSLIFSIPGFFIYIIAFYILNLFSVNIYLAKSILILLSLGLILTTLWAILHEINHLIPINTQSDTISFYTQNDLKFQHDTNANSIEFVQ